jgi:HTH-type transcriptional repressor of NAD biosynthesis genes
LTRGLVFGKFYPPHRGHKLLIDRAAAQCDALTVMVMSAASEDISGELRASWLAEIHPDVTVMHTPTPADLPQSWPEEDEASWARFVAFIRSRHAGRIDKLFTSEWYGESTARRLGCEHVSVDPLRHIVPISGTQVRDAPWQHADALEPCVRAHYVVRVAIVGAESTGKTTLAKNLAAHFQTLWVPEFGREFSDSVGHSAEEPYDKWKPEDFAQIAKVQQERADVAARSAFRVLICDTDPLATQIWQERYTGVAGDFRYPRCRLYLFTSPDIPFVQDGTRDGEHVREWMTKRFEEVLLTEALPFVRLRGTADERFSAAVAAIEEIL